MTWQNILMLVDKLRLLCHYWFVYDCMFFPPFIHALFSVHLMCIIRLSKSCFSVGWASFEFIRTHLALLISDGPYI